MIEAALLHRGLKEQAIAVCLKELCVHWPFLVSEQIRAIVSSRSAPTDSTVNS